MHRSLTACWMDRQNRVDESGLAPDDAFLPSQCALDALPVAVSRVGRDADGIKRFLVRLRRHSGSREQPTSRTPELNATISPRPMTLSAPLCRQYCIDVRFRNRFARSNRSGRRVETED